VGINGVVLFPWRLTWSGRVQALTGTAENLKENGRLILRASGKTMMRVFELMRLDTVPNLDTAKGQTPEDERT
jgi:hypothetical protein